MSNCANSLYQYSESSQWDSPERYSYPEFQGQAFLDGYFTQRSLMSHALNTESVSTDDFVFIPATQPTDLICLLTWLEQALNEIQITKEVPRDFEGLLQYYEVHKKLYIHYCHPWQKGSKDYRQIRLYIYFSLLLVRAYALKGDLRYLNCLLKVHDLIISVSGGPLDAQDKAILGCTLQAEVGFVRDLHV